MLYGQDFESNVRLAPTPYIKEDERELIDSFDTGKGLPWIRSSKQQVRKNVGKSHDSRQHIPLLNSKSGTRFSEKEEIERLKQIIDQPR